MDSVHAKLNSASEFSSQQWRCHFYRWGNQGTKGSNDSTRVTQLRGRVRKEAGSCPPVCTFHATLPPPQGTGTLLWPSLLCQPPPWPHTDLPGLFLCHIPPSTLASCHHPHFRKPANYLTGFQLPPSQTPGLPHGLCLATLGSHMLLTSQPLPHRFPLLSPSLAQEPSPPRSHPDCHSHFSA